MGTPRAHDWGQPPWQVELELPGRAAPGRVDVAVVGGGLTGLSCALELARAGRRVALLEATRIGAGASARSGGLLLEGTAAGALPGTQKCLAGLRELVRRERIDCALELGGCDELCHREPTDLGEPGWRDEAAERRRLVRVAERAGGTLDPGALVAGLARRVELAGVTICEGAPVFRVGFDGDEVALDLGDRFCHARHAVLALGGFTRRVLADGPGFESALSLATCTEPLSPEQRKNIGIAAGRPFYVSDRPGLWGRLLPDGRAVFGAGLWAHPRGEPTRTGIRSPEARARLGELEARVRGFHPALRGVAFESHWAGPVSFREDGRPVLYRDAEAPNVIVTGAYAGRGIALAVALGAWAARAIAEDAELPRWGRI